MKKQAHAGRTVATVRSVSEAASVCSSRIVPSANWNPINRQANLDRNDPDNRNPNDGTRAAVRVQGVFRDLSQPPSIRPISAVASWIWKIVVALASFSSSASRSFNVRTSK